MKTIKRVPVLLGFLLSSSGAWGQPQIQQVLECMRANVPSTVQFRHLQLSHFNRLNEASDYEIQLYAQQGKGQFEASALIKKPTRLAGGAYLLKSTGENYQLYVYAPGLGQVKRITGEGVAQSSLLGTDLSWADLQIMYSTFLEGTMSLTGQGTVQGRPVHRLQLIPSPKTESVYNRIYLDVDQESCVPLEIRLMEKDGVLRKHFTVDANSLTQTEGYWYASKSRLADVLEGTHTEVTVLSQARADDRLRDRYFNSKKFYRDR